MKFEELQANKTYYGVFYSSMLCVYEPPEFFTNQKEAAKHYNYLKKHYQEYHLINTLIFAKIKTFKCKFIDDIDYGVINYIKSFNGKTEIKW